MRDAAVVPEEGRAGMKAARELDQISTVTTARLEDANRKFAKHVETATSFLAEQLAGAASTMDERKRIIFSSS